MGVRGTGGAYLRGSIWWLRYHVGGRKIRISTGLHGGSPGKPPKAVTQAWADKLSEIGRGNLASLDTGVRWEALVDALVTRYTAERRTVATVNMELRLVRRAFRLLRKRIPMLPEIRLLPGARVRQGTVPDEVREAIEVRLTPRYRAAALFLRLTGWRTNEACRLEWRTVDWGAQLLRLETSKNGEPRFYAFRQYHRLGALLRLQRMRQHAAAIVTPWVFPAPTGGKMSPGALGNAWTRARKRVGYSGGLHDLRRTRIQEQDANGMPLSVGMSATGIKSVETYRRYAVVSIRDQEDWLGRLEQARQEPVVRPFASRRKRP